MDAKLESLIDVLPHVSGETIDKVAKKVEKELIKAVAFLRKPIEWGIYNYLKDVSLGAYTNTMDITTAICEAGLIAGDFNVKDRKSLSVPYELVKGELGRMVNAGILETEGGNYKTPWADKPVSGDVYRLTDKVDKIVAFMMTRTVDANEYENMFIKGATATPHTMSLADVHNALQKPAYKTQRT